MAISIDMIRRAAFIAAPIAAAVGYAEIRSGRTVEMTIAAAPSSSVASSACISACAVLSRLGCACTGIPSDRCATVANVTSKDAAKKLGVCD
jgi:hypothetical protein